jgi:hypothetical protein
MISPVNMCREAMRELRALGAWVAVVPVYNPRLGFYRDAYRVARRTGARRVLALGLDGRFFELTRLRFLLHRLMDWKGSKLLISFFLTPYIFWLLMRTWAATAGAGVRTGAGRH